MENLKYGNKIVIIKGMFEGNHGIFFKEATKKDYKGLIDLPFRKPQPDDCIVEIFLKTQAIECPENIRDYFKDYLFNENTPKKMTSVMVIMAKRNFIKSC